MEPSVYKGSLFTSVSVFFNSLWCICDFRFHLYSSQFARILAVQSKPILYSLSADVQFSLPDGHFHEGGTPIRRNKDQESRIKIRDFETPRPKTKKSRKSKGTRVENSLWGYSHICQDFANCTDLPTLNNMVSGVVNTGISNIIDSLFNDVNANR